jgi:hypothetical protein
VSRRERWPNRGSGSGSSIHSYMLLAGFGTDTVVVYCQYVFVWHVDPGKEKMLTASSTFDTLTFIYWGLLSIILKRLPTWARTRPVLSNDRLVCSGEGKA